MALETYRKKRQFDITPEPRGRRGPRDGYRYVIQKHAARRVHYDLRLELDGVMKSWAVTRGPSPDPNEKRLAVHVEDHPIEYNSFEGTIPKGEYGGGTVMIWDRGTWTPEGDPHKGYAKGHLVFDLHGEKLHGRWHLVRMRARDRDRHENWLLIKGKDEDARGPNVRDILERETRSAATGRSMEEIASGKGKKRVWHSKRAGPPQSDAKSKYKPHVEPGALRKTKKNAEQVRARARELKLRSVLPEFVPFSLATLADKAPSGAGWLHEIKLDGYRIEARLDHGQVRLLTRKQQDWTQRFKSIAEAVAALPAETAILDGEIVVEDARGVSSFSMLQTDLKEGRDRFICYVFDLLYLDGRDLTDRSLLERKAALAQLLKQTGKSGVIRYTDHFDESGPLIFKHACDMGLEGIISKRREARYRSGRSDNFVKSKCRGGQEFVVAGYTPATVLPNAIGALTVAARENGELRYAGRVGTGYTRKLAHDLFKRLAPLRTDGRPIELPADERRKNVIWVKPKLVIEVESAGVTHGGVLRQASFKGIREDKTAEDLVREVPVPVAQRDVARNTMITTMAARNPSQADKSNKKAEAERLHLTHPDRVFWPDAGITKLDLAEYYIAVWDWIRPHILGRALSLVRAPEGIGGETFFQKHIAANVKSSPLRRAVAGKDHDVIAVENLEDLVALVQSAALEIHVRGSRLNNLETCDRIVFDLDPGEGVAWTQVIEAARETRERLQAAGIKSFVKLSGGKGFHVVAPIADAPWDAAKLFTQRIAAAMAADSPKLYLAKMTKALRHGRIFIDYFRNSREATSVAAYSTRSRTGAPVSAPVAWERLGRTSSGHDFTMLDATKRLKEDAWADIGKVRQKLPDLGKRRK